MNLKTSNFDILDGYSVIVQSIFTRKPKKEYGNEEDVEKYPQQVRLIINDDPDHTNIGQRFRINLKKADGLKAGDKFTLGKSTEIVNGTGTIWAHNGFVNLTIRADKLVVKND